MNAINKQHDALDETFINNVEVSSEVQIDIEEIIFELKNLNEMEPSDEKFKKLRGKYSNLYI